MSSVHNISILVLVLQVIISCCQATNKLNLGGVNAGGVLTAGGLSGDAVQLPTGGGVIPGRLPSSSGNFGLPRIPSVVGFPRSSNLAFPQSKEDQFLLSDGDVLPGTQFGQFKGVAGGIYPGSVSSGLPGFGGLAGSRNVYPGGLLSGILGPLLPVSVGGSLISSVLSGLPGFGGIVVPALGGNQILNGIGGGLISGIGGILPGIPDVEGMLPGSPGVPSYPSVDDLPLNIGENTKGNPVSSVARMVSRGIGKSGIVPGGTLSGIAIPMLPVSGVGSLSSGVSSGLPGFGGAVVPALGVNQILNGIGGGLISSVLGGNQILNGLGGGLLSGIL